jgi:hypothetical protein
VTNSESKEQPVFDEKEPMYKFWTLRKKLLPPTPLQEVTIEYKDAKGAANSVTLSMEKPLADWLAARLLKAEERKAELRGEWWGDQVWKTKRNETGWGGAGEIASRE